MNRPEDQVLVIFGASGDLTKRMLMPSLYELHVRQMLPERFVILGTSRKSMSDEEFRLSIRLMLEELKGEKGLDGEEVDRFLQKVFYQPFDPVEGADELGERVMFLMEENAIPMQVVYYLATPPNSQQAITKYIGRSCLFGVKERGGWHRIVVEKPFGTSLETAKELDKSLLQVFCEQEIYRIDHFLGKETVQNILVLRFANEIFESLWNRNYVDYVEIYALESLGIENRGKYYETAGALRDMVQNHFYMDLQAKDRDGNIVHVFDNYEFGYRTNFDLCSGGLIEVTSSVSAAEYDVVFYRIGTDGASPVVEDVFRCVGTQTGNDTVSFQYTESGKEKKEDSIITRKSIVCARKVLQNIMESGTNFTRKNISERSTGDEVCGHMITLGTGVPGTAM